MEDTKTTPSPPENANLQELAGTLLSNPDLIRRVRELMQAPAPNGASSPSVPASEASESVTSPPAASLLGAAGGDGLSAVLSNPALLEKLPQILSMLSPMLSSPTSAQPSAPAHSTGVTSHHATDRDHLLLALKPFLSRERQEAVDAILRIARLGVLLKQLS